MSKRILMVILAVGLMLGLASCLDAPSPVGCVSTVNGKCVQTGTKPPAMF